MSFHPIVLLPEDYVVLDFTGAGSAPERPPLWSVGRYDEVRPSLYTDALFSDGRSVHMGLDIGGPVGVAVHAFADGVIEHAGYNPAPGDYGHVLVTRHHLAGGPLYVLLGHLSAASTAQWSPGAAFPMGAVLGWLGAPSENGGWPPHVHVQLSLARPETHDLPGVVHLEERAAARARYPDPRRIAGALY
ncbi:MAG: peptidoglycan DD-metalloendopeptidase family protein [Myxococcota bacterium]